MSSLSWLFLPLHQLLSLLLPLSLRFRVFLIMGQRNFHFCLWTCIYETSESKHRHLNVHDERFVLDQLPHFFVESLDSTFRSLLRLFDQEESSQDFALHTPLRIDDIVVLGRAIETHYWGDRDEKLAYELLRCTPIIAVLLVVKHHAHIWSKVWIAVQSDQLGPFAPIPLRKASWQRSRAYVRILHFPLRTQISNLNLNFRLQVFFGNTWCKFVTADHLCKEEVIGFVAARGYLSPRSLLLFTFGKRHKLSVNQKQPYSLLFWLNWDHLAPLGLSLGLINLFWLDSNETKSLFIAEGCLWEDVYEKIGNLFNIFRQIDL